MRARSIRSLAPLVAFIARRRSSRRIVVNFVRAIFDVQTFRRSATSWGYGGSGFNVQGSGFRVQGSGFVVREEPGFHGLTNQETEIATPT
jgi:hypothetical protein